VGQTRRGPRKEAGDLLRIAADHLGGIQHVVEADEDVRDEETALRQARALRRQLDGRLEPRGVVVGEVADDRLSAGFGLGQVAKVRAAADERVAAQAAALDGFEQERGAALAAQPQVSAEWRDEIGCDVRCDGHDDSLE
jgi:hypothetical protein